jgi:Fe-S oxidoreductase
LPPFPNRSLVSAARNLKGPSVRPQPRGRAVLFPDIFTNYGNTSRGLAALEVLRHAGIDVQMGESTADGRAPLSQGLISTAAKNAQRTSQLLLRYIDEGRDVIVVEPSVLAMFRFDYRHFVDRVTLEKLRHHCFDTTEYLWPILQECGLDASEMFPATKHPLGTKIFYHSHCQQKTIGAAFPTEGLLRAAGFNVVTSNVECCGMAGSFGYKKEYYELSMAVGEDLFEQVRIAEMTGPRTLVATGTSCHEQLHAGLNRAVFHPMELLRATMA